LALVAAAGGDQQAFARFYDLTASMIYGLVLRVIRNPALAEEVCQEVYVELWRLAPRYDADKGSARAWSSAIAHRRAVDRVRSEQAARVRDERDGRLSNSTTDSDYDPVVEEVEGRLDRERVGQALGQLADAQREALTLAFFGGHTYVNVARMLSVPEGTIKTRIRDGLARIRDILEGQ
jgi:RNA polymerase sigma-70 factor (ECF subfamily)